MLEESFQKNADPRHQDKRRYVRPSFAVALIIRNDGKCLTQITPSGDVGLPGGPTGPNGGVKSALRRKLMDSTGIKFQNMYEIYSCNRENAEGELAGVWAYYTAFANHQVSKQLAKKMGFDWVNIDASLPKPWSGGLAAILKHDILPMIQNAVRTAWGASSVNMQDNNEKEEDQSPQPDSYESAPVEIFFADMPKKGEKRTFISDNWNQMPMDLHAPGSSNGITSARHTNEKRFFHSLGQHLRPSGTD